VVIITLLTSIISNLIRFYTLIETITLKRMSINFKEEYVFEKMINLFF